MLMNQQEASGRWCPFGRQPHIVYGTSSFGGIGPPVAIAAINRQEGGDVPSCLGPLCTAWRWYDPKPLREIDMVSGEVLDEVPRRGYCGLSGRPEHGE